MKYLVPLVLVALIGCGGSSSSGVTPTSNNGPISTEAPSAATNLTVSQSNAVQKAIDYLSFSSFSKQGLIKQLEFEGFSSADAKFAVENIDVDWFAQAAKKAKDYLSFSSFSRKSLTDQLIFEGFTAEEAAYGVEQTGL